MNLTCISVLLGFVALLQACASAPVSKSVENAPSNAIYQQHLQRIAAIQQFSIKGRIGVQADGKGFSGRLTWQHDNVSDDIALYSPLGGQIASIKRTVEKVTLEDAKGNSISAADAEMLTQTALGWRLPLTGLADWSLGRPARNTAQASVWDAQGHLISLKQDGWDIEYQNYSAQNGYFLPNKILLKSEGVTLKLLVEQWDNLNN
ncbi:MAG: outer membrane lipoprotein LolB [Methylotenera sp.]|nr:outer membrane lipoprotein LolB [Methylotenera sp.]MSP99659.1 outer membrane lipoprotein LolB [Methylotenera sp.]